MFFREREEVVVALILLLVYTVFTEYHVTLVDETRSGASKYVH